MLKSSHRSVCGFRLSVVFAVVVFSTTTGCSTDLSPFADSEAHYTVAGYLDTGTSNQVIRVVPIRGALQRPVDDIEERPVVSTTELQSGDRTVWRDSLVTLDDGNAGLAYVARFDPLPGRRYRLEISGDRGTTHAEVLVPETAFDSSAVRTIEFPSLIYFPVFWPGVNDVIASDVFYRFSAGGRVFNKWIRYQGEDRGQLDSDAWRFIVRFIRDREVMTEVSGSSGELSLSCMVVQLGVTSEGWQPPPGGVFDPSLHIQPGVFSNVENGLGWFGAVTRVRVAWPLINVDHQMLSGASLLPAPADAADCIAWARETSPWE